MTKNNWYTYSFQALGTHIFLEARTDSFFFLIEQEAARIEQKYSRFIDNSYTNEINRRVGDVQKIDEETFFLLQEVQTVMKKTNGCFNPIVLETLEYLGYDAAYSLKLKADKPKPIKPFFELINQTLKLDNAIDFGGFGKGYFVDQARRIMLENRVESFLINAGGDMYAHNLPAEKNTIFLEDPRKDKTIFGAATLITGHAFASSPKQRTWGPYHHLISPETQKPANKMLAVYVQASEKFSATQLDAYSTALFVMGYERAKIWLTENKIFEALVISPKGQMFKTENYKFLPLKAGN